VRKVSGEIVLPDGAEGQARAVTIEVRDVSVADAPSSVVAAKTMKNVKLTPRKRIKFSLQAPEVPGRRLALRVQIDKPATRDIGAGSSGYLTTQSIEVSAEGDATSIVAPVTAI
jgi:putative lipoprotein